VSARILVVDDEAVLRSNLVRFLQRSGHDVDAADSAEAALEALAHTPYAVVLTDLKMPGMGGLALLRRLADVAPDALVLVVTAYASLESAIEALRLGAQDYLLKPLSLDEVRRKVERLLHVRALEQRVQRLRREVHGHFDTSRIVAASASMQAVLRLVARAAPSRSTVLVEGESGTGKELIARALHDAAPWADRDFIAVNLAAQPSDLVDATLFGHEAGAYTGASHRREGVFRAARGGTVFLDEISELSLEVQAKLLRVLETREVLPLGRDRPESVDFRLVVATNRPLAALVEAGAFRQDLYFRLEIVRITLPPLRERLEELAPLARRFLRKHAQGLAKAPPALTDEALALLSSHDWPGNVRELSNVLERAVLLSDGDTLDAADLPGLAVRAHPTRLEDAMAACERAHIRRVLAQSGGDKRRAAEALGIHLATLYRRMERLGISQG
jgi:DNA-binding NtrC family response regulator